MDPHIDALVNIITRRALVTMAICINKRCPPSMPVGAEPELTSFVWAFQEIHDLNANLMPSTVESIDQLRQDYHGTMQEAVKMEHSL